MSASPGSQQTGEPRVSISEDGLYVHIGFDYGPDTILKVGGYHGPGGWKDVERARQWVAAVQEAIAMREEQKP